MIRLQRISRSFDVGGEAVHALVDVNEEVAAGEHVAIMGPSGSGKSTLLNVVGCLDRPDAGRYELLGRDVSQLDESELTLVRRHTVGFVFQFFHLVPRLKAIENVELPMLFAGVPAPERRERARARLDAVGLAARAAHRPDQLSGGERQRAALARATVLDPRESDTLEGRIELHNGQTGPLRGTAGLQYTNKDLGVSGEEAFLPPDTTTESLAVFGLQHLRRGPWHWEFGLRVESQENSATNSPSRDFEGLAANLGLLWRDGEAWSVGASLTHADRLPSAEELYANGAHLATASFEVGDPAHDEETARGAVLPFRRGGDRLVTGSLNVYFTSYNDYIFAEQQFDKR